MRPIVNNNNNARDRRWYTNERINERTTIDDVWRVHDREDEIGRKQPKTTRLCKRIGASRCRCQVYAHSKANS